jgi:hypothetical protein
VNALVLAMMLSAAPSTAPSMRVQVGGQVGFPFLLGVHGSVTLFGDTGKPRFDADLSWEPSASLQSYSIGGAYHVLDSIFFVGPRLRLVQFQPPWARGSADLFFGLGAELGVSIRVAGDKGVVRIALHGTGFPAQASNLSLLFGLSAGFSWSIFER